MKPLNRRQAFRAAGAFALAAGVIPAVANAATRTTFMVTIRNVATDKTLQLPDGRTTGAPISPGVYVVAPTPNVLFKLGSFNRADYALERLAEDGNVRPMLDKVSAMKGLTASGMFVPGQPFTFTAAPGDLLQFATMFVQSNDLFFAPRDGGIALFRPEQNARRFQASAERAAMPRLPEDTFLQALDELVTIDAAWIPKGDGSLYLRPVMLATEAFLGRRPSSEYLFLLTAVSRVS